MGLAFTKIWQRLIGKQEMRILMVGLDAAGKTTILYKLKLGEVVTTIPTIGFNVGTQVAEFVSLVDVETVERHGRKLCCVPVKRANDMAGALEWKGWAAETGQDKIRPLWRHYYQGTNGLIYVVDSNDRDRVEDAREEPPGALPPRKGHPKKIKLTEPKPANHGVLLVPLRYSEDRHHIAWWGKKGGSPPRKSWSSFRHSFFWSRKRPEFGSVYRRSSSLVLKFAPFWEHRFRGDLFEGTLLFVVVEGKPIRQPPFWGFAQKDTPSGK
ncbi:unnamed protein product [Effrenium voratum]|uniref:ADP-ribosylation factor n=1 Tax=Effrenium voratum TaxID=2562239 RepID=A0AA36JBZ7_9DINO|nr:unnamed protein product [Effrenium voratum]